MWEGVWHCPHSWAASVTGAVCALALLGAVLLSGSPGTAWAALWLLVPGQSLGPPLAKGRERGAVRGHGGREDGDQHTTTEAPGGPQPGSEE